MPYDRAHFTEVLTAICGRQTDPSRLRLADRSLPARLAKDAPAIACHTDQRLTVIVSGSIHVQISAGSQLVGRTMSAGDAVFYPSLSLEQVSWRTPVQFLGLVFRQTLVRYVWVDHNGMGWPVNSPAYHTARPLEGAGLHLLRALDTAGDAPIEPTAAAHVVDALLRCARDHLAADDVERRGTTRSYTSWYEVMAFVNSHYTQRFSREEAAAAIGLHPNYLSSLCKRYVGKSFQELVESVRVDRAKHYLSATDWKLWQVARQCGFSDAAYLCRVFKAGVGVTPGTYRRTARTVPAVPPTDPLHAP